MAIITGGEAQNVARTLLEDTVRDEIKRHALSSTSEMIGYVLDGMRTSESYNKAEAKVTRHIAAPEFLTGLLKNEKT